MKIKLNYTLKRAKQTPLVFKMNADIAACDKIVGMFGRSGAGKTTILKTLAGLCEGASCEIEVLNNEHATHQALFCGNNEQGPDQQSKTQAHKKSEQDNAHASVYQQYVNTTGRHNPCIYIGADSPLFEHLSVRDNLNLVMRHSQSRGVDSLSLLEAIELCNLHPLVLQYPSQLSSGEKQRVCFARGLLSGKKILLLDEAFSALDWTTRKLMHLVLHQLVSQKGYRAIMVSHSLQELSLCVSQVLKVENGTMTSQEAIDDVVNSQTKQKPLLRDELDSYFSVIRASYSHLDPDQTSLQVYFLNPSLHETDTGAVYVKAINTSSVQANLSAGSLLQLKKGETRSFVLHANQLSVSRHDKNQTSMLNCFEVRISEISKKENGVLLTGICHGQLLRALITQKSLMSLNIRVGQTLFFLCKVL